VFTLDSFYILGLLLAELPSTRNWKNNLQFFFSKTLRFILRFLYLWVAYFSGDTRNEELAKLVYLQREQAIKSLIINYLTQHSVNNHLAGERWKREKKHPI